MEGPTWWGVHVGPWSEWVAAILTSGSLLLGFYILLRDRRKGEGEHANRLGYWVVSDLRSVDDAMPIGHWETQIHYDANGISPTSDGYHARGGAVRRRCLRGCRYEARTGRPGGDPAPQTPAPSPMTDVNLDGGRSVRVRGSFNPLRMTSTTSGSEPRGFRSRNVLGLVVASSLRNYSP